MRNSLPPKFSGTPAERAKRYVDGVLKGIIPVGKGTLLAVQRHVKNLEQSKRKDYPYYFSDDLVSVGKDSKRIKNAGSRVVEFIEELPHTKGKWAANGELLKLGDWQCFIIVTLFGWLRKVDNKRRFRSAYICVSRKNGKSQLAAGIGLYMLLADGEFGGEVYSGATSEKQAWEVFRPAKQMLERTPELQTAFGAQVCAKALVVLSKGSKFEPVIGNPGDGPSPSCAIVDEYHEHITPALHDSMETGMGAREQPLLLVITTAGYNTASPCYEKHAEVLKVLQGLEKNETQFGIIYGIDEEDNWADPKSLLKANPNYDVSVDAEFLKAQQRGAMANPVQQNKFKTKHLDMWCSVRAAWMNAQLWLLAADPLLEEEEVAEGADSWISFDLASKTDLCSEQRLYRKTVAGKPHYYLFGRYWLPEETVEEDGPNRAHYAKWVKQGVLTQTDGATVDFEEITEQILEDAQRMNPREVVYDPFNATHVAQKLQDGGVKNLVEFTQLPHNFAVPMDEFISILKDGRFHHDGNEMTTWCVTNVVARPTKKGLFAPMKSKPHLKIDGAVAAIMGLARAIAVPERERAYQMITLGGSHSDGKEG